MEPNYHIPGGKDESNDLNESTANFRQAPKQDMEPGIALAPPPPLPPLPPVRASPWMPSMYPHMNDGYPSYSQSPFHGGWGAQSARYLPSMLPSSSGPLPFSYTSTAAGGVGGYDGLAASTGVSADNWLVRTAEDSTRDAFNSIETFVRVVASISHMLDSTYMLLHNSFRSVVSVAEQSAVISSRLVQLASTLSLVRSVRWLLSLLARWLGYRVSSAGASTSVDDVDSVWSRVTAATTTVSSVSDAGRSHATSWPVVVYLLAVLAAPYLMYRALASSKQRPANCASDSWMSGTGQHYVAVCQYTFTPPPGRGDLLAVVAGQRVRLAPRHLQTRSPRGWVLAAAALAAGGATVGLVPASHVRIEQHHRPPPGSQPPSTPPPPHQKQDANAQ